MCGYLFPLYFYMFYSSFVMLLCKTKRQIIFINRLLICILFPFLVMVKFVSGDFHQRFDDNFRNQPDDAEINYCGLINRWPPNERSILTFRGFNCFIQNSVFFKLKCSVWKIRKESRHAMNKMQLEYTR